MVKRSAQAAERTRLSRRCCPMRGKKALVGAAIEVHALRLEIARCGVRDAAIERTGAAPEDQLLPRAHLPVYLDEFVFRHNTRPPRMAAFLTLLGLGALHDPTTYDEIDALRRRPELAGYASSWLGQRATPGLSGESLGASSRERFGHRRHPRDRCTWVSWRKENHVAPKVTGRYRNDMPTRMVSRDLHGFFPGRLAGIVTCAGGGGVPIVGMRAMSKSSQMRWTETVACWVRLQREPSTAISQGGEVQVAGEGRPRALAEDGAGEAPRRRRAGPAGTPVGELRQRRR